MTVVVTVLLAALFLTASALKLLKRPSSLEARDHFGLSGAAWTTIGLLELAGAVGVLVGLAFAPLGVAAAGGLVLTGLGALATHLRAGDSAATAAPAVIGVVLAVATVILQAMS